MQIEKYNRINALIGVDEDEDELAGESMGIKPG